MSTRGAHPTTKQSLANIIEGMKQSHAITAGEGGEHTEGILRKGGCRGSSHKKEQDSASCTYTNVRVSDVFNFLLFLSQSLRQSISWW